MDTLVSAVTPGLSFVSIVWRLILIMIDSLSEGVPILNDSASVKYPAAPPSTGDSGISYYISCKYQSDLIRTPRLFLLMLL